MLALGSGFGHDGCDFAKPQPACAPAFLACEWRPSMFKLKVEKAKACSIQHCMQGMSRKLKVRTGRIFRAAASTRIAGCCVQ